MSEQRHPYGKITGLDSRLSLMVCLVLIILASVTVSAKISTAQSITDPREDVPAHPNVTGGEVASQVDVNLLQTSEPAPMGIADYGIGPSGAYSYSTTSFLGIVHLASLSTKNSTDGRDMSMQLNVVLEFTSRSGTQYDYWIQNVAGYTTTNNIIYFEDNVWNMSSRNATMSSFGISGNGQVYTLNRESYYATAANPSLPGDNAYLTLPTTIRFEVNSTINSQKEARLALAYDDGYGWQVYDIVTFPLVKDIATNEGLVVNGTSYNPFHTFYDAELVFGGVGNGWNTTNMESKALLQLQFYNGHNYQQVYNAYNFGSDTTEGIDNVTAGMGHYDANGSLGVQISAGSGSLGRAYSRSQVSIVNIQSSLSSGMLYLLNESFRSLSNATAYTFTGDNVNVTVAPGSYIFYLY
ncbi:MAG: thermopsin, partial [Rhabdochlamydiaceae bacterium]